MEDTIPFDAVNALSLELHTLCHELSLRDFQARALAGLEALVPFDSALLAVGTVIDGVPEAHDAYLYRQTPELMVSWEPVKHEDVVSLRTTSSPGRTMAFVSRETYPEGSAIMAHCERFGILQLLSTASLDERAGSFVVLSLYRASETPRFTERERAAVELVVPHLVASTRQAKLDDLRRATHVMADHTPAAAIINRRAVVLEADPRFIDLLAQHYKDFRGPKLPAPLAPLAAVGAPERRTIGRLVVRADPAGDVVLVHARVALPVDTLTDREREVALHFASGLSTQEIAARLEIARNTVRVHVTRVYAKLGVANRAELASMLAGLE